MLHLGKSKPWKDIMEMMTGVPKMDTAAFREYFAPLEKWLTKYNKDKNNWVSKLD
jgi:peptidyl-dipeptidase A